MSLSIPSDNLRKINNLDEIPYKNVTHPKVYYNYLNHRRYLLTLSGEEIDNQIQEDINEYNNYIDLIIRKNNRISSKVKTEYNNLLTKLTADRDYINNVNEDNDINLIDSSIFNEENDINTIDPYLLSEENNFSDVSKSDNSNNSNNSNNDLEPITSIKQLLSFSEGYTPDKKFFDETELSSKTDNYKKDTITRIVYDFNVIDEAIKNYNLMVEGKIDDDEIEAVLENIVEASKKYKYYYYDELELRHLYPLVFFYDSSYSKSFREMLYSDYVPKYLSLKDKISSIDKMYLKIRYYRINYDQPPKTEEASMQVTNSNLLPEYVLQGYSKETIIKIDPDVNKNYSGAEGEDEEVPLASLFLSFEFINGYDRAKEKKYGKKLDSTRTNREGQLFQYKINRPAFEEYFKNKKYVDVIIKHLNRYQIFEEFNPVRDENRYNCLMYSLYTWFCENKSKEYAEDMCRQLSIFNISRIVTSNDINKINEYFKNIASKIGVRYKIDKYVWNENRNRLKYNGDNKDKSEKTVIPICLLETGKINGLKNNHYLLKEDVNFKELNKEDNNKILELIAGLKEDPNKRNWKKLSSYSLIKYLFEDKTHNFFTEFNAVELKEILDEKDEIKNKMKNKKLIDCIKEMTDYERDGFAKEVSVLKSQNKTRCQNKSGEVTIDNVVSDDPNWNNEYEKLCVYDFEASTQEKDCHKAYMVCYCIMDYPKTIYSDAKMKYFVKNFDKKCKIETIYGEDCAKKFLDALPDKCLCYAHNARYDLSFFNEKDIDISIKSCEKDNKIYSRNIKYNNKHITFKDSFKLIPSKLKLFPSMFKLGNIVKEVFPYNFYSLKNLKKYEDKDIDIDSPEYDDIRKELIKSFGNKYRQKYIKFKNIIRTKFNGIFNMKKYSEFYCKRDVEILIKGLICMRTYTYTLTKLDCFNYLTIPSIIHRVMLARVYTNTGNEEKAYMYSGYINQYIQSALYGGVCTSWRNSKLWVDMIISDYDAKSLYPSAINRLYIVTGMCDVFTDDMIKNINNSMYDENGNYDCNKCWLLDNTNKEKENDKNKINAYIATIKITDSSIKRNSPRIIIKNEIENGKLKYPHLPEGNVMVNVDKDFDVNDEKYKRKKEYYVKEVEVPVDNIMLEDYIKYHGIKFELIGGIYWKNSEYTTLYQCFENLEEINDEINKVNATDEEKDTIIQNHYKNITKKDQKKLFKQLPREERLKICKDEIEEFVKNKKNKLFERQRKYEEIIRDKEKKDYNKTRKYFDLIDEYHKIQKDLNNLINYGVYTVSQRRIRENYKKQLNDIKEQIYDLDKEDKGHKSSKHFEIQDVIQEYYDSRAKYQKEGNPIEKVIKLLLNSVYGKTIQNYTDKKVSYVKLYDKNYIKFNSKSDEKFKKKLLEKWGKKLDEQYKRNEITKEEYDYQKKDLESIKIDKNGMEYEYSPYRNFLDNNKNKIVKEEVVNDNMMRIETIEQIKNHYTLNLLGVQILSMSKRIMNEVICTAEDIGIRVYYQDTDSIHIDDDKIELLEKEFEKRFGRKLRGDQLGQFHPDFDKCNIKNNNCVRYVCNTEEDYEGMTGFIDNHNDIISFMTDYIDGFNKKLIKKGKNEVINDILKFINKHRKNIMNKLIEREKDITLDDIIEFVNNHIDVLGGKMKNEDKIKKFNSLKIKVLNKIEKENIHTTKYYIYFDKSEIKKFEKEFRIKFSKDLEDVYSFIKENNQKILIKSGRSLSKLLIVCGKKMYLDILFDPDLKSKDYTNIDNFKKNYHIRLKGIPKKIVFITAHKLKLSIKELYLKLLKGDTILFKISKYLPSFKFTNQQTVINAKLERELVCGGGYYKIDKNTKINLNDDPKYDPEYVEGIKIDKKNRKKIKKNKVKELRKINRKDKRLRYKSRMMTNKNNSNSTNSQNE